VLGAILEEMRKDTRWKSVFLQLLTAWIDFHCDPSKRTCDYTHLIVQLLGDQIFGLALQLEA
jgi:hypothetical protein